MTALQTTTTTIVIPLRPDPSPAPALPNATPMSRLLHWSESWQDELGIHLPNLPVDLIEALPAAIDQARKDLTPGDAGEVLVALSTFASRRGFPLPEGPGLEMDVEALASWPRDLWRKSFRAVWEKFAYRRLPEVPDFRQHIEGDLAERRERLARLESLRLRLETVRLRQQWNLESRQRRERRC